MVRDGNIVKETSMTMTFTKHLAGAMAATILSLGAVSMSAAGDLSDAQIIGIYSQVNSFDIETAMLGELKGHSEDVRALGRMVSGDHTGVRAAVHALASENGIEPMLPPSRIKAAQGHDDAVVRLRGLEGSDFDAAYLRHEIAFHQAAIDAVENLLIPETENEALRAHFEAVLPAFQHHLDMNIAAAEKLGVAVAN